MTEKMKEFRHNNKVYATVVTDLSKTFDCLLYNILIAKLHTYSFNFKSQRVIHTYLNDAIQVAEIGFFYSETL